MCVFTESKSDNSDGDDDKGDNSNKEKDEKDEKDENGEVDLDADVVDPPRPCFSMPPRTCCELYSIFSVAMFQLQ